jgi:hypothetical protein
MPINSFLYPATQVAGGYEVANSVRLQDAYFNRSVTPSSATSWTLSFWIKISGHNGSSEGYLWSCGSSSEAQGFYISASSYLGYYGATGYGSDSTLSQGVLRDSSAWYHICFSVNSGTGTLYINGVQDATMSSVAPLNAHTGNEMTVNTYSGDKAGFDNFLGYMAEYVFIDGTALTPTSFGEFDEDSGIWKPIDVSGLTFGNNGFYLDFENSGSLGADVSGNGNNFTVNNLTSVDQSTDTCTNNFATINPLFATQDPGTMSEGNTIYTASANAWGGSGSTIGLSQGKWYFEIQLNNNPGGHFFGVIDETANVNNNPHQRTGSTFFYSAGEMYRDGSSISSGHGTFGASDIGGVALNLDDNQITIYKNGSAIVTNFALSTTKNTLFVWVMGYNSGSDQLKVNFGGTPPFTISSGNSDGNGYGNFEYAVPSGYYALNTKNLAQYG